MKKITLETLYTPYTLDTYSTFMMDSAIEMHEENINEDHPGKNLTWDDIDWTYKTDEFIKDLADNLVKLLNDNILDDVITAISYDGKPSSPREYNFVTDKAWLDFTVDEIKLKKYIEEHQADYNADCIRSRDGFMWLGDEEHTDLNFYLNHISAKEYTPDDYFMDQYEQVDAYEYIEYKIKTKS